MYSITQERNGGQQVKLASKSTKHKGIFPMKETWMAAIMVAMVFGTVGSVVVFIPPAHAQTCSHYRYTNPGGDWYAGWHCYPATGSGP